MPVAKTSYRIYDLKTGQAVALIDSDGTLHEEGDPEAIATLKDLLQRELIVREREPEADAQAGDEAEGYELFPEGSMCYFGLMTLRPGDPEYISAFLSNLPSLSYYEARPVQK